MLPFFLNYYQLKQERKEKAKPDFKRILEFAHLLFTSNLSSVDPYIFSNLGHNRCFIIHLIVQADISLKNVYLPSVVNTSSTCDVYLQEVAITV